MPRTAQPILYDLFWRAPHQPWNRPVAQGPRAVLREPFPLEAVILYPAFLTPEVVRLEGDDDWFELVLATIDMRAEALISHVNERLQVQLGLDPERRVSFQPLFADPSRSIEVKKLEPTPRLRTDGGFRGMLHPSFKLPELLQSFYQVRIRASCLAEATRRPPRADAAQQPDATPVNRDWQDRHLHDTLNRLNGPALRQPWGFGHHCFRTVGEHLDLAAFDPQQPLRAYHPLFVYQKGEIGHFNLGHASDLHLNARQVVLQRSDARVIDAVEGEDGERISPRIGGLLNVYAANFASILKNLDAAGADAILLGGDLVDHHHNCFPFTRKPVPEVGERGNPASVWRLVDLASKDDYAENYQAFVDMISFYSLIREHIQARRSPVFVVTGNHDAYQHAFGIAPRVMKTKRTEGFKANGGIPADHNLTFYEAILLFGPSYGEIRKSFNFNPDLLEWFFTVLTPFSDYAVELPQQRLVGLHWGDHEKMISAPFTGHGIGHLPRADKAATPDQVALLKDGLRAGKRTVLFSHFTFASYVESIACGGGPVPGRAGFGSRRFSDQVMGTFQEERAALYEVAADDETMQAVFTGHSHRKGLYTLRRDGDGMNIEGYSIPMDKNVVGGRGRVGPAHATPVIVSDCAGPVPRLNLFGEFGSWGSDRPSGTLARVSPQGRVSEVVAVGADALQARPRLAVCLEYLSVMEGSDAVFRAIRSEAFAVARRKEADHGLRFTLGKVFERVPVLTLAQVTLWSHSAVLQGWTPLKLTLHQEEEGWIFKGQVTVARVPADVASRRAFLVWLSRPATGRFMSLGFSLKTGMYRARGALPPGRTGWEDLKQYNVESPWIFEVDTKLASSDPDAMSFDVKPRFEKPNFDWRRQFPKYQS